MATPLFVRSKHKVRLTTAGSFLYPRLTEIRSSLGTALDRASNIAQNAQVKLTLEYFLAASRAPSYTQAAARMFTSRQNLSHAIKELERKLGVALFAREGVALTLTPEGEETARRVQAILNEVDKLKSAFAEPEGAEGPLRILVGSNIFMFSPYDVSATLDELPRGSFRIGELDCQECYEEVASSRADVAVVACMERSFPDCEAAMLHQDSLYLLVGEDSSLAEKISVSAPDVSKLRLMVPPGYEYQLEPLVRLLKRRDASLSNVDAISSSSEPASQAIDAVSRQTETHLAQTTPAYAEGALEGSGRLLRQERDGRERGRGSRPHTQDAGGRGGGDGKTRRPISISRKRLDGVCKGSGKTNRLRERLAEAKIPRDHTAS